MELKGSHPLENITRGNPYSMLEALIPFVDYPMKLPLALLIKYQELRLILNAFQSADSLSKYGLHNSSSDPMEMLGSIMGISPEMLKTLMSLMESQGNFFSEQNVSDSDCNNYVNYNINNANIYKNAADKQDNYVNNNVNNTNEYTNTAYNHSNYVNKTADNVSEYSYASGNNHSYVNNNGSISAPADPKHDSFDENIKNIFAEYDLLQAAEYNEENKDLIANSISDEEINENSSHISEPEYYI